MWQSAERIMSIMSFWVRVISLRIRLPPALNQSKSHAKRQSTVMIGASKWAARILSDPNEIR